MAATSSDSSRRNAASEVLSTPCRETATMGLDQLRAKARKQVEDAIKLIPTERKASYLEALEKVPHLIDTESDPLKFLRRCGYNIWDASERLCLYWEERKDIFGPERAFLPLTLTGDGALDKHDILTVQAGFPSILPRSQTSGLQVVYADRRQNLPCSTAANRFRVLFYLSHILAKDERAQTEGVLVFILLMTPRFQDVDHEFVCRSLEFLVHAMPIKIKWHILNVLPKGANRKLYSIQDMISTYVGQIVTSGATDVEVHIEREHNQLLEMMQNEFGLTKAGIPAEVGGSWSFVEASLWCRNQASIERKQFKWLKTAKLAVKGAANGQQAPVAVAKSSRCIKAGEAGEEEQARLLAKKRSANVIHSRRKRERTRQHLTILKSEQDQLQQEQKDLKKEHAWLESLLAQAQAAVESRRSCDTLFTTTPCFTASVLRPDDDDHSSQCSGENPQQRKRQRDDTCDKNVAAVPAAKRPFAHVAAEAVCRSPEEQMALMGMLLAQQQQRQQQQQQQV